MFIKKIQVKGKGKKSATLVFKKGLNVVAGASDTGKSYITQCIQFVLGSSKIPKSILESKGYTNVEVTVQEENGTIFILKRELVEKSDIIVVEKGTPEITKTLKPSNKGKQNISSYFLEKISLNNLTLAKGIKALTHSALTLRILEKIFIVDEHRIISESSPIGKGQYTENTQELSLLKTLLTGFDDSEIKTMKGRKSSKESLKKKIENLEEFLNKFYSQENDNYSSTDNIDKEIYDIEANIDNIEIAIEKAQKKLYDAVSIDNIQTNSRRSTLDEIVKIEERIREEQTLVKRFELLKQKYDSDKERLIAGVEATQVLDLYENVACPTCGRDFEEDPSERELEIIISGTESEIRKIESQIIDLSSTIDSLELNIEEEISNHASASKKLAQLNETIDSSIGEEIRSFNGIVAEFNENKATLQEQKDELLKRKNILVEIGRLQLEHDKILDSYDIPDFSKELFAFAKEVFLVLARWGFPYEGKVNFDNKTRDIIIGDKPRGDFGKGYRAICFSAFIIALFNILFARERHPGFIVLDSPLTTYKKADSSERFEDETPEERLSNNMIYAFYRDLCDSYNDKQIIIFENQEPDLDLTKMMQYQHFSKNENVGRYGFFPIFSETV